MPQILGTIPSTESLRRLEAILSRVRGDKSNREYEVEMAIKDCKKKLGKMPL